MKKRIGLLVFLFLLLLPIQAQAADSYIMVMTADGAIVPAMHDYIDRGLDIAEDDNVALVIIKLDTPGGSVGTTEDIVQRIRGAEVPVVVYVAPRGGWAASAGALITLSGHASMMAPETVIGASSPISGSGSDLDETSQRKAEEILTANMRTLTEHRGPEAQQLAQDMITEADAVTATEALEIGLIDYIAEDEADVINWVDANGLPLWTAPLPTLASLNIETLDMSLIEQLLLILTDPTLVFMLLSVGVLLVIIEFRAPGGFIAGTLGGVMIALSLYGLGVLPVNFLGVIFIFIAAGLFLFEMVMPGTQGATTVAGAISLAVGGMIMFNHPEMENFGGISIFFIVGQSVAIGVAGLLVFAWVVRSLKKQPITGEADMIGSVGTVRKALEPQGWVFVHGERWRAETADGLHVDEGEPVRVINVQDLVLTVEPVEGVAVPHKRKN